MTNLSSISHMESTEVRVTRYSVEQPTGRPMPSNCTYGSIPTSDLERNEVTRLVDQLLARTKRLMMSTVGSDDEATSSAPTVSPRRWHHTVAFSGGVDSSLVAALIHRCSLDLNTTTVATASTTATTTSTSSAFSNHQRLLLPAQHSVQCVMGVSEAVPSEQIATAESMAIAIGVSFQTVPTEEGRVEMYVENNGRACFACKTELYSTLKAVAEHVRQTNSDDMSAPYYSAMNLLLYNGTNADDLLDPTRLGLVAAANFAVQSPIDIISKEQVRLAARHLGLTNWNVAASPCLRSRLALGVPATTDHLQRIAQAERFVRTELYHDLPPSTNLRVRLLANQQARVEVDVGDALDTVVSLYKNQQVKWERKFLDELKFTSLTITPFRSGSVATPIVQS